MTKKNAKRKPAKKKPAKKRTKPTAKKPKKTPEKKPSKNHDSGGKFKAGNKAGKGNPYAKRTAQLRKVFFDAITDKDMHDVARALIRKAKKGDVLAIKELLMRLLGQYQEFVPGPDEKDENWVARTGLSDGSYLVIPVGKTDPVDAYHARLHREES